MQSGEISSQSGRTRLPESSPMRGNDLQHNSGLGGSCGDSHGQGHAGRARRVNYYRAAARNVGPVGSEAIWADSWMTPISSVHHMAAHASRAIESSAIQQLILHKLIAELAD